jgi:hypothetical protein
MKVRPVFVAGLLKWRLEEREAGLRRLTDGKTIE